MLKACAQENVEDNLEDQQTPITENIIFELDFETAAQGTYTQQNLINEGGDIRWSLLGNRANIIVDPTGEQGQVLKVDYPEGTVGPETNGIQFIKTLPASNEYYLDYFVFY